MSGRVRLTVGLAATMIDTIPPSPFFGAEPLNCSVVATLDGVRIILGFQLCGLELKLGDHRSNGVQRIVTRQTFVHEPSYCPHDACKPSSKLVLHNGMECRVNFHTREFDAWRGDTFRRCAFVPARRARALQSDAA